MKRARLTAHLNSDPQKVWDTVCDISRYGWRSDLREIRGNGERFVEVDRSGIETQFTVTRREPCRRYEFDLENRNLSGHWTGVFTGEGSGTGIEFTEEVSVKNPLMSLLAGFYLKKQQKTYLADLRRALGEAE